MTLLTLIRHGETDWNRQGRIQGNTDVLLNDTGLAQAAEAAALLDHEPWSGVVTLPLSRARVTGEVIATSLGVSTLPPMSGLAERDYGECEGVEMDVARSLYPSGEYPGSESNESVFDRALSAINVIRAAHPGDSVIVVAHGGLLHTLLSRLNGARVPSIANATVNVIKYAKDDERWVIQAINSVPHEQSS